MLVSRVWNMDTCGRRLHVAGIQRRRASLWLLCATHTSGARILCYRRMRCYHVPMQPEPLNMKSRDRIGAGTSHLQHFLKRPQRKWWFANQYVDLDDSLLTAKPSNMFLFSFEILLPDWASTHLEANSADQAATSGARSMESCTSLVHFLSYTPSDWSSWVCNWSFFPWIVLLVQVRVAPGLLDWNCYNDYMN